MAKAEQKVIPSEGMNLSVDELYMPDSMVRFLKGWYMFLGDNNSSDVEGSNQTTSNAYVLVPNQSNELFSSVTFAPGINKSIGGGFAKETNKYYSCIWNDGGNHSIWELDANNRVITKVIQTSCLDFQYDPVHFITPTRFTYAVYKYKDKAGKEYTKTWIFITDDHSRTKQINVEDAIATNGFSHPFFENGLSNEDNVMGCCDLCTMITMGAPTKPTGCIDISPVVRPDTEEEKAKPNPMNFRVWQWRLKHTDVWGRESIHGVISRQYFNSPSTSCTSDETKYPRCVDLGFDAGCKWIASITLEYRNCGVGNSDLVTSDWVEYETIYKYSECLSDGSFIADFWERPYKTSQFYAISETNHINFDQAANKLTVRFCANRETKSIPTSETSINQNYIANKSNGISRLGNKILVTNNERGFNPLLCDQLDKIRFTPSSVDSGCNPLKFRKITIWGYIYSPIDNVLTNVRYFEASNGGGINHIGYGRCGRTDGSFTPSAPKDNPYYYRQEFENGAKNFIMYAVGHEDIYAEAKQFDISDPLNPVEVGIMSTKQQDSRFILRWEFYVPSGSYVFRISEPKAGLDKTKTNGQEYYRTRSANMIGLTTTSNIGQLVSEQYELHIDACDTDINLQSTPVMIWDLSSDIPNALGNLANALEGYVVNEIVGGDKIGVEQNGVTVDASSHSPSYICQKTDANGHYFGTTKGGVPGTSPQLQLHITDAYCTPTIRDTQISSSSVEYIHETISYYHKVLFTIKGKLQDQNNAPIVGEVVVYENGRSAKTDANGEFKILANGLVRTDQLIFANSQSGCVRVRIDDDCSTCFDKVSIIVPDCSAVDKTVDIGVIVQKSISLSNSRSIMQGRYGAGIVLEDCLGMETFLQAGELSYVDIANTNSINSINYDLTGLQVPSNFKKLSFYVTENLTYQDWMEWSIDYGILEDNNGNISAPGLPSINDPRRLRIYINSLINYTAYSQSNTSWQFLKGDLIQFFELSNGTPYNTFRVVSYREGENYVTVDYDSTMADLVANINGAKIRLLRPRLENPTEAYYQLCKYINLTEGVPDTLTGVLEFSNVFKISRAIPIYTNNTVVQNAIVNIYDTQGNVVGTKEATNVAVSTPTATGNKRGYILNHNSPSDFFGNKCWGMGRVTTKNKYEKVHRFSTEISLSNGISAEGMTNYLHHFTTDNATSFDTQVYNAITGVVTGQNIILAICTNDYFTLLYDQNEFRVDQQSGQIYALSATNRFGKPRTKVGDDYGCAQKDINTIQFKNGLVFYVDSNRNALVRHNFEEAQDWTPMGMKGWLQDKIIHNSNYNIGKIPEQQKAFIGIIDDKRSEYILTSFKLDSTDSEYVNNERGIDVLKNETVAIDINDTKRKFNYMYHPTPEMWGYIESDEMGLQLLSFQNGKAYIHYPYLNAGIGTYLNFFGIQCKPVIEAVFNQDNGTNKNWLYLETMLKQHQLYADRVMTESGQLSRIMPMWWDRKNNYWSADFKCQTNGIVDPNFPNKSGDNAILDGELPFGKWIKVRLVTKDSDDSKYAELNFIKACFNKLGK